MEKTFALIIGGGPVGLTLALELGSRNVPTILANEENATTHVPRANYLNLPMMEYFRRLGIGDEIRAMGTRITQSSDVAFRTQYCGHEMFRTAPVIFKGAEWPSPEYIYRLSQIFLEPLLKREVERHSSVDLRFGWKADDIHVDDNGARATLVQQETGARRVVEARYLIGCDGAHSAVRDLIGAKMVGKDGMRERRFMSRTRVIYFIRAPGLASVAPHVPAECTWIINNDLIGFILPHDESGTYIVQYLPARAVPCDLDGHRIVSQMLGASVEFEILGSDYWEGGLAKVADTYQSGAAFLAGDAAHTLNPLVSLAISTGIEDVINLGWKIAASHEGWGGPGLLNSYTDERQEMGVRNSIIGVHNADRKDSWTVPENIEADSPEGAERRKQFGRFIQLADENEYQYVNAMLGGRYVSSIVIEPSEVPEADPDDEYAPADDAGSRLPHFWVDDDQSIYDLLGFGFTLLAFGNIDTSQFEACAAKRGVPLKILGLSEGDQKYLHNLILVRPDLYIAWSADELPDDVFQVIDIVRGSSV